MNVSFHYRPFTVLPTEDVIHLQGSFIETVNKPEIIGPHLSFFSGY